MALESRGRSKSTSTAEPRLWNALGPGLLFAGAAVGVSHLVQSTRAGATYGFALVWVVVAANILKYPVMSFGPRYAAATGKTLVEGYAKQGRWALLLYSALTVGTVFTVQAAVTLVTAALAIPIFRLDANDLGITAVVLTASCAGWLAIGRYKWLDRLIKIVMSLLTVSTLATTALALPRIQWHAMPLFPRPALFSKPHAIRFLAALVGWMPAPIDVSVWHSLWTLAQQKETGRRPNLRVCMFDFDVGYWGTALLALCFISLGAGVMYASGETFSQSGAIFASQLVRLYTANLGEWAQPIISTAAFTVMFSTTLTVMDGFPRALAQLLTEFTRRDEAAKDERTAHAYWGFLLLIALGSILILQVFRSSLKSLVDLATSLSFLTAPALAWLNHRAVLSHDVPQAYRPGPALRRYSWLSICFSAAVAAYYIAARFAG